MQTIHRITWTAVLLIITNLAQGSSQHNGRIFINEIHYDNRGTDRHEAVEIGGPAGADLTGWKLVLYNGSTGKAHWAQPLSGVIPEQQGGAGAIAFELPHNALQNGPDGLALVDAQSRVVQFLSYEGNFPALDGPAQGLTSTDIGVQESRGSSDLDSLQLAGNGAVYEDFHWTRATASSFGQPNLNQRFSFPGDAVACSAENTLPPLAAIPGVQGSAHTSPRMGETVTIRGVVTGMVQTDDGVEGYFVQDHRGDGDSATSDGLYLLTAQSLPSGHRIEVQGRVIEHFGMTALQDTELKEDCGVAPDVPVTTVDLASIPGDLEPFEGMRVRIEGPLEVVRNDQLLQFGEIGIGTARTFVPTNFDGTAPATGHPIFLIDDGRYGRQPERVPLYDTQRGTHRVGAKLDRASGVLGYGYGAFRLHPAAPPTLNANNPRANSPPKLPSGLRVAGFNLLNFFVTLSKDAAGNAQKICGPQRNAECRGAESVAMFERQRAKLLATMTAVDADILGLVEIENTDDSALEQLVDALNEALGAGTYDWIRSPFTGPDTIRVALIYKPGSVTSVGSAQATDPNQDPAYRAFKRPVLAQTFKPAAGGPRITVAVTHFKSKGSCPAEGDSNADQGQGCWNLMRTEQARQLVRFTNQVQSIDSSHHLLIIGDLNAYGGEDPIHVLEAAGLIDMIEDRLPPQERYSYYSTHDRSAFGYLDHALASPGLAEMIERVTIWHSNSDEPLTLRYNHYNYQQRWHADDPFGASDHDPVIIDMGSLTPLPTDPVSLYYRDALSLRGEALRATLSDIVSIHHRLRYRRIWDLLANAHQDPDNADHLILFYSGRTQPVTRNSGHNNADPEAWNREHVWARSHGLGRTRTPGPATDAHNLWPTDASINSSRGNKDFDNGGTPHHEAPDSFTDSDSWEPRDEVKGEVARTLFYMALRYEGENNEPDLVVVDRTDTAGTHMGKLCALIDWHEQDTVSTEELRRNEVIHRVQGNRNPFVDHPEWVSEIWGHRCGTP